MNPERPSWASTVGGFLVASGVLFVLVYVVGIGEVLSELATVDPALLLGLAGIAVAWMFAWSCSLHLVLTTLGTDTTVRRSFLVFSTVLFANNVAPFSVLGAEPFAALLVSRGTGSSYERSFATVTSVDVLNFLPAPAFAVFGLVYFAVTATLGTAIEVVILSLLAIFVLLVLGGSVGWRYRRQLAAGLLGRIVVVERRLAHRVPWVPLPEARTIEERIAAVLEGLERVAASRRTLAFGVAASTVGWTLLSTALWLALYAVGYAVPIESPLFVVPLVTVTDLVPFPGGVGSVDAALVLLLVATTGVPAAAATAAVIVYRSASLLFPILVGAAVLLLGSTS